MFSHAFTLFSLLALSSAGLLEVTPSRLYLPATTTQQQTNTLLPVTTTQQQTNTFLPVTTTQQQTNTLLRASHPQTTTIQLPSVLTTSQQIPAVSTFFQQLPVTRTTQTYTVNAVQPAQIHTASIPAVVSQQIPVTRTTTGTQQVINTAQLHQIQTANTPSVFSTVSHQVPVIASDQQNTHQFTSNVNTNTLLRTSQPAQLNTIATSSQQVPIRQIAIVRLANENVGDGTYSYNYETDNGITAEEQGQSNVLGAETVERVQGSYSYTGPDNVRYTVTYVADENGYRAEGAHLPVPPTPVAQAPQVTARISQITRHADDTRSATSGVHVIPTTVISQPLQIVQAPSVQSQRQSLYQQQVPVVHSQQNILRQSTVLPTATLTVHHGAYAQQTGANFVQTQGQSTLVPSSVLAAQQGTSGYTSQQTGSDFVQTHGQSTLVPSSVLAAQQGTSGYTSQQTGSDFVQTQGQSTLVPSSFLAAQQGTSGYTSQQTGTDSVHTQQVIQRQSTLVPSTVTVHQGVSGYTAQQIGSSAQAQLGLQRQSTVVPSSTLAVQHGTTGYTSQQSGLSGNVQQNFLRQSTVQPSSTITVQQGNIGYTTQTGVSSAQQQGILQRQAVVVPANTVTVQQQTIQNQQEIVQGQNTVIPSTVAVRQGSQQTVQQGLLQHQVNAPSGIVTVHQGRVGVIKQHGNQETHAQPNQYTSGVSSSHVTVQLGTTGYATEQIGDTSSVQILEGGLAQNTVSSNVQQVTQQTGGSVVPSQQVVQSQTVVPTNTEQQNQQVQSQTVVPTNTVSEQQTTNQGTTGSQQGVVLPDGTVHYGY